jgi:fermentation-respiration switch protein FrsA (DUF1100 family)
MSNLSVPLATIAGVYLLIVGVMFVFQRGFLYYPDRSPPDLNDAARHGLEPLRSESEPGIDLMHLYRPPRTLGAPVVVIFHGNAGHMGHRVGKYHALLEPGFGVLITGYRGYGGNPGKPSEAGLTADARSVMALLAGLGIGAERIVLYGESLGSGVAVKMAAEHPVAGLVLEAPYTSIADVAQAHYWYLPARWLLLDKWDSTARIGRVSAPILIVHGENDRVVPTRFGKRLFELAPEPKSSVFVPGAGHNALWDYMEVHQTILDFVAARRLSDEVTQ